MDCFLAVFLAVQNPPLADRHRFPPRDVCSRSMRFNRGYLRYVELQQSWYVSRSDRYWYWKQVQYDTNYIYRCWDCLNAAQGGEGGDKDYWRRSLLRLKELIGDEAYYLGVMPPPAPICYFVEID